MRPTVRARLAAIFAGFTLAMGTIVLAISYALVRHSLETSNAVDPPRLFARPRAFERQTLVEDVRDQLQAATLHQLLARYLLLLLAATLIAAVAGWLVAGRTLRPLQRITAAARRVSQENLGERIALDGPQDELQELADTFDTMLARLDQAFAAQRGFVANASHELRTPLAIIRTEVDVALEDPSATAADLREMARVVRIATERSERLIDSLLTLARSDRGDVPRQPVDVADAARAALSEARNEIQRGRLRVEADLAPAPAFGDRALLERMVGNLVQNAARHNVPGGWLSVTTRVEDGRAALTVANAGPPITEAEAADLVTPFRRLGRTRGAEGDGFGLGLSIVDAVVRAHGGRLAITAPGEGLIVSVELPARPRAEIGRNPAGRVVASP